MTNNPCSSTDIVTVIDGINKLIKEQKFDSIDAAFARADPAKMKIETMLCWIRTTFAVREKIPRWEKFMRDIATELENRGHDAKGLLQVLGLD